MDKETIALIRNALRQATIQWAGRRSALDRARVKVDEGRRTKAGKIIEKYYWRCAKCDRLYRDVSEVEVDHIIEIGSFEGDWNKLISKMFCPDENLQVLCVTCHMAKTTQSAATRWERKPKVV